MGQTSFVMSIVISGVEIWLLLDIPTSVIRASGDGVTLNEENGKACQGIFVKSVLRPGEDFPIFRASERKLPAGLGDRRNRKREQEYVGRINHRAKVH
jgi:hypothetical protein